MSALDAHAHLWRRESTPQPWIDPVTMAAIDRDFGVDDLAAAQKEAGVGGSIVVQSSNSAAENRELLALVDGRVVRGVVGWLDLESDVDAQLDALRASAGGHGLVGVRHLAHQDADDRFLARPTVGRGLATLGRRGLPFDLVVRPDQLGTAAEVVSAHPETAFVLDHLGKPPIASGDLVGWARDLAAIARWPNVSAKLSGLAIEADWTGWTPEDLRPVIDVALAAFGPSRTMFGTDWPLVRLTGGAARWRETVDETLATLEPGERAHVLGGTARLVYAIPGEPADA